MHQAKDCAVFTHLSLLNHGAALCQSSPGAFEHDNTLTVSDSRGPAHRISAVLRTPEREIWRIDETFAEDGVFRCLL